MKNKIDKIKNDRFKLLPKKKDLKIYINERLRHTNSKVKRFIKYDSEYILLIATVDKMAFTGLSLQIQDVSIVNKEVTYLIRNDIYGFGAIIDEIEYFRKFPNKATERNFTVI